MILSWIRYWRCMAAVSQSRIRRTAVSGADQGVVQFDLQESLKDERREASHRPPFPECGKGFGNGERSYSSSAARSRIRSPSGR